CARERGDAKCKTTFSDERVCKMYLLNCCPHEILAKSRSDLGECEKMHSVGLRADYRRAAQKKTFNFEKEAMEKLEDFLLKTDRQIEQNSMKLQQSRKEVNSEISGKLEVVQSINDKIGSLLTECELLKMEGRMEEASLVAKEVEHQTGLRKEAEENFRRSIPLSSFQQQKLKVCDICGAYLMLSDKKLCDHFTGKLHVGYFQLRVRYKELLSHMSKKIGKQIENVLEKRKELRERKRVEYEASLNRPKSEAQSSINEERRRERSESNSSSKRGRPERASPVRQRGLRRAGPLSKQKKQINASRNRGQKNR
uniref:LUC7 like n=1 Tax=Latimeria chalumnae TaxID=7897 RepID=H3AG24_LATCH